MKTHNRSITSTNTTLSLVQSDISGRSFTDLSNSPPFSVITDGTRRNKLSQGNRLMVPSESSLLGNRLGNEPSNPQSYGCISNYLAPIHSNSRVPPVQPNHDFSEQVQLSFRPLIYFQNPHRQVLPRSSIAS